MLVDQNEYKSETNNKINGRGDFDNMVGPSIQGINRLFFQPF